MPLQVLRNNTIKNDDWMKTLPGYKDELALHDQLGRQLKEGGSGSGNFGHSGVPGQQGGSQGGVTFSRFREDLLRSGERFPTQQEEANFRQAVSDLNPAVRQLGAPPNGVTLTVEPGRAECSSSMIMLDEKYLYPTSSVAQHEYIHAMVNGNGKIYDTLGQGGDDDYKPPFLYSHAARAQEGEPGLNEQLVMNLSAYPMSGDHDEWITNVERVEMWTTGRHTTEEATAQVEAVEEYLKGVGIW